jgi:hypothetical protein
MNIRNFTMEFGEKYPISVRHIRLKDKNFPLQQLHTREQKGWIFNLIRGRWILPKTRLEKGIALVVCNMIYEPSYLSLEWALRYYNLIPESVSWYTACTTKKTQTYHTELGSFVYRTIQPRYYRWYDIVNIGNYSHIRVASPEKTICDYIYLHPEIIHKDDFEEQRINREVRKEIASDSILCDYANKYPPRVQKIAKIFLNYIYEEDA